MFQMEVGMRRIRWTLAAIALALLAGCSGLPAAQPSPVGHDSEAGRDTEAGHGM